MSPVGVLHLTIQSAHITPWSRLLGGAPDPFVSVRMNSALEVGKTIHLSHDFEPTWMESMFIVVDSLSGTLSLQLYDHHDHRRHVLLGEAWFGLAQMSNAASHGGHNLPLIRNEKHRGELLVNIMYYPATEAGVPSDYASGIVTLHIVEARHLDAVGGFGTIARLRLGYNGTVIHATGRLSGTNPAWADSYDFYHANRTDCVIVVQLMDSDEQVVGELSVGLEDVLEGNVEWWPLSGCMRGELKMNATWRGIGTYSM